jgi:membrane protease YdiL (CAAX protease family)
MKQKLIDAFWMTLAGIDKLWEEEFPIMACAAAIVLASLFGWWHYDSSLAGYIALAFIIAAGIAGYMEGKERRL